MHLPRGKPSFQKMWRSKTRSKSRDTLEPGNPKQQLANSAVQPKVMLQLRFLGNNDENQLIEMLTFVIL